MWFLLLCLFLVAIPGGVSAEVFHSKESALRLAFPDADVVEKKNVFLSGEKLKRAGELAGVKLPSRMVTMYVGRKEESVVGYAFIDTHKVRSLPETILVVLDPDGQTRGVYMLAFHEPPEYAPTARWLGQFEGRPLDSDLSLRGEVDGITGATLTANAITATVRSVLAVFQVTMESG
jgi:Na+-translocating ferredoxin:NAD+ oxidoreductase RnfG subunit